MTGQSPNLGSQVSDNIHISLPSQQPHHYYEKDNMTYKAWVA